MNENSETPVGVMAGLLIVVTLLFVTALIRLSQVNYEYKCLRDEAIQIGYAQYNPTNAVWQWKTNVVLERK